MILTEDTIVRHVLEEDELQVFARYLGKSPMKHNIVIWSHFAHLVAAHYLYNVGQVLIEPGVAQKAAGALRREFAT